MAGAGAINLPFSRTRGRMFQGPDPVRQFVDETAAKIADKADKIRRAILAGECVDHAHYREMVAKMQTYSDSLKTIRDALERLGEDQDDEETT